ncbi:MAG: DUF951 domain-containing protein [Anaerovoracaceae bacterium]
MSVRLEIGDRLTLKKAHPCGGNKFEVIRAGMDVKLKCCGCGSQVTIIRNKLEKNLVKINAD